MKPRTPPRLAEWLLQRLAASYRRDSLLGDLLEEYQQGHSRGWYWRQVGMAASESVLRFARSATVTGAARLILRVTAEILAILGIVSVSTPEARLALGALAVLCLALSSARTSVLLKRFATAFAIVTLGAATLTWAAGSSGGRTADTAPPTAHCSADSR